MFTLALISLGVSMDAAAVSGAMAIRRLSESAIFKLAFTFGAFQFGMSLAGSFGGVVVSRYLSAVDHWIVLAILGFVGGKMIHEAITHREEDAAAEGALTLTKLLTLGVATSIDAFAVGVTLPSLDVSRWIATISIGTVTFLCSLLGAHLGRRLGAKFGTGVEVFGGLVLIGLGVKTVVEHLTGAG